PVPTKEYYSLAGIFYSTEVYYGTGGGRGNRQSGALLALANDGVRPAATSGGDGKKGNVNKKAVAKQIKQLEKRIERFSKLAETDDTSKGQLATAEKQLAKLKAQLKPAKREVPEKTESTGESKTLVMGVQDSAQPTDT